MLSSKVVKAIAALLTVAAITGTSHAKPSLVHATYGKANVVCTVTCTVPRYQVTLAVSSAGRGVMTISDGLLAPLPYTVECVRVYPTKWGHNVFVSGSSVPKRAFGWLWLSDHKSGTDYATAGRGHIAYGGICNIGFGISTSTVDLKSDGFTVVKGGSYTTTP